MKKYEVEFKFNAPIEGTSEGDAMENAAWNIKYHFEAATNCSLNVVGQLAVEKTLEEPAKMETKNEFDEDVPL